MISREINIIKIAERIFEKTMEIMPETTVNLANMLMDKAHELWTLKARNAPTREDGSVSGWGEKYASTLKVDYLTGKGGKARVYADENHPNFKFVDFIEEGVKSWSIKDALLKGKAAQRNFALYGTVFVNVPFRYRVPGKTKESDVFAGIMPQDIYDKVKKGETIPKGYGKYTGLRKFSDKPHTQYLTFRTVTPKSDDWVFPAKKAIPVFAEVKERVEKMIEKTLQNFVKGFMDDLKKENER